MPRITPRICGVCPTPHHMAATKATDAVYHVEPTSAGRKLREILYSCFIIEDHAIHFFFLGGPDFVVGPDANAAERNILGVINKVGLENGKKVIEFRKRCRDIMTLLAGKAVHPVCGLPGGVSRGITEDDRKEIIESADFCVELSQLSLKWFEDIVLKNKNYVDLVTGDVYRHETHYMGMVDENNKLAFYDGKIRVVAPDGEEVAKFEGKDYLDHIEEHMEPWTYIRCTNLKQKGWTGFNDGKDSGIYRVGPLGRINACDGFSTPLAQAEYEKMFSILGEKPSHSTLAYHWARLIEMLHCSEWLQNLANDPEITDPNIRNIPTATPDEGVGAIEAARGTLIHHYKTDEKGLLTKVNLIVATQHNAASIFMSIDKSARKLISKGKISDGLLNMVEMAFRAYDPCLACATHSLPGQTPLDVKIYDSNKNLVKRIVRD
jgi:F420-non-reducing hydrogenase large subunit